MDANKSTAQLVAAALPHMVNSVRNVLYRQLATTDNIDRLASEAVRNSLQYLVELLETRDALIELTLAECSIPATDEDNVDIPMPTRVRMLAMESLLPGPEVQPVARGPIALKTCACTGAVFTCVKCNGLPDDMLKIYEAAKAWFARGDRPHGQYKAWSDKVNHELLAVIAKTLDKEQRT